MSEVKEIRSLTGLRGLAAVYVMFFHYWIGLSGRNAFSRLIDHGYLSVDLFFVLSGFVMTLNYAELFRGGATWGAFRIFLGRRIARVYPLYFAATLCGAALAALGWAQEAQSGRPLLTLLANLAMVQTWGLASSLDPASWSVSAEWAAYLLFPAILWLVFNPGRSQAKLALAFSAIWLVILSFLPSATVHREVSTALLDLHDQYHGWPVLRCLPEFLIGVVTARIYTQKRFSSVWLQPHAGTAVCAVILLLLTINRSDLLVVALAPVLILTLTGPGQPSTILGGAFFRHLGILSYSIYLVHALLGGFMVWAHRQAGLHGLPHGQTIAATAAIALVYPCALASYHLIEKPGRGLLRRYLEPKRAPNNPLPVGPLGVDV